MIVSLPKGEVALFLKSLEMFGFKSFADRTTVEFPDGITALLGPNGCGKSNVVDAIKWVLGEQASRSLRAEKMEDVIFNGTENRKPLNMAEVSLTLSNDTGILPLDMPEVQIKRRLYRSGESEYFINTAQVRLKEVRQLFWDTGVGKAAYSVMEQGKIDQILSSKPDERRYLFEEAAGITRFKVMGVETGRKLVKTAENMRQVEGIIGEVKRTYDSLKSQADKTLKYRTLREDIFTFELDIQLLRLKQFRSESAIGREDMAKRTAERDALRVELDEANQALEENLDTVNALEDKQVAYQQKIYGLAIERNAKEKEAKFLAEQRNESKAKIAQNEGRERTVSSKIEELTEDAGEQDGVVRDLRKKGEGIQTNIASFEQNIQLTAARIGDNDKAARAADLEIKGLETARKGYEQDLETITDDIVAALDAGLKEAGYSATERRILEEQLVEVLSHLKTTLARPTALTSSDSAQAVDSANFKRIAKVLAEAKDRADEAFTLFESYQKITPSFIDEFLAPEGIITKKRALDAQIRANKEQVESLREKIAALRKDNDDLGVKVSEYHAALGELRVSRVRLATQAQSAEEKARLIRRELAGQESLLRTVRDELFLDRKRFEELGDRIFDTEEEIASIERNGREISAALESLETEIAAQNSAMAGARETIKEKTAGLNRVQERLEKLHLELVQSETEIKNIQDNFRETHSRDLLEFEDRIEKIDAPAATLREKLATARNALKNLGQVNLMAPEEFSETKERYDFLANQLADLAKARDDLENIAAEIRAESSELFVATYNKIKKNFHNMFRRLFGGGRAELRLQDPNHVLESGIEIFAQPPGKKLENITLLSGGEKSMTAVALLFATYMVKPSPFCLLDEIDAALDEANVSRFLLTLREFGDASQFIVITHNRKTMVGASTLIGVSMEELGVTKVVSVRLEHEEAVRDEPLLNEAYAEEEIEPETGRELPVGIDDPALVSAEELHPIRSRRISH
jgi:chromosome segregation protein